MRFLLALAASLSWLTSQGIRAATLPADCTSSCTKNLQPALETLRARLSPGAVITLPADAHWKQLQVRGTSPRIQPRYTVVVEPATERDVRSIIQVANQYRIPFLAVSGTHGWTKTLNNLPCGFQIRMRKLNTTAIQPNGKTAIVGGGTLQWEVTKALAAQNKQAVTGLCECVSVVGPALAGGHSMLQAQHGYSLDNIVSARVALADGSLVTASKSENADLFWALQGAGHNFGIVTSVELKIYEIRSTWTVYSLVFTRDKIAQLFDLVNRVDADPARPSHMYYTGVGVRIPPIDPVQPVIAYTIAYEGSQEEAARWAAPFQALGPAVTQVNADIPYANIYNITQNSLDSAACRTNLNAMGSGASLPSWNTQALQSAFAIFAQLTSDPRFNTSVFLFENYGMQGVRAVDPASTALSLEERQYPIVANPTIWWNGTDPQATKDGYAYGERIRSALFAGLGSAKKHTYVNYAIGTESVQQMYGHEAWRLAKLQQLKRQYDPRGQFSYYNPVPAA